MELSDKRSEKGNLLRWLNRQRKVLVAEPDARPGLHLGADMMEGESVSLNNNHPTVRLVGIIF